MLSENNKYQEELSNIMNGIADSVLEMSDEEIEEEIREEGDNTEEIRQVLLNAVKSCRLKSLREAKERHETNVHLFQETKFDLPDSPEEKRSLIQSMLGSFTAPSSPQITAQFRDYESLPDEDLDSVLLQLYALQTTQKTDEQS
jgi:predicted ATPase with chaperone activity